jgi:hypothetical protein
MFSLSVSPYTVSKTFSFSFVAVVLLQLNVVMMWEAKNRSHSSLEKHFVPPFYVHPRHCVAFRQTENSSIRSVCIGICRCCGCSSVPDTDPQLVKDAR